MELQLIASVGEALDYCITICTSIGNKSDANECESQPAGLETRTLMDFLVAALLSGTLRTIQRAACDGEMLSLRCPLGTAVSIQLAQYGRPSPGISLCPGQDPSSTDPSTKSPSHQQQQNDSCALTPSMQVQSDLHGKLIRAVLLIVRSTAPHPPLSLSLFLSSSL